MQRALIVVDVQNDFCEGGSLAVTGGARAAADISAYLEQHAGRYARVVATQDHHVDPGAHFAAQPDYSASWPAHCVAGTPGAEFHPNLTWRRFDAVFLKGDYEAAYSGFEGAADGVGLADWLREAGIDAVDVCGIATDYCVRATALDAARLGFRTRLLLGLTAAVAPGNVEVVVEELRAAGVEID